jgi:hypothetical protein
MAFAACPAAGEIVGKGGFDMDENLHAPMGLGFS